MKRFTETTKWDDPWYRKLSPNLKLLWQYICDKCDSAGVLDYDAELAAFQIGCPASRLDISKLGERVRRLASGKYHITRFIEFQYGHVDGNCKAHRPIIKAIELHGLEVEVRNFDRVSKGYPKGMDTHKEKEKEKDQDQGGSPERGMDVEIPAGMPKSEAQAISSCSMFPVEPEFVAEVWRDLLPVGFKDGARRDIASFPRYIEKRWRNEGPKWLAERNGNAPAAKRKPEMSL